MYISLHLGALPQPLSYCQSDFVKCTLQCSQMYISMQRNAMLSNVAGLHLHSIQWIAAALYFYHHVVHCSQALSCCQWVSVGDLKQSTFQSSTTIIALSGRLCLYFHKVTYIVPLPVRLYFHSVLGSEMKSTVLLLNASKNILLKCCYQEIWNVEVAFVMTNTLSSKNMKRKKSFCDDEYVVLKKYETEKKLLWWWTQGIWPH